MICLDMFHQLDWIFPPFLAVGIKTWIAHPRIFQWIGIHPQNLIAGYTRVMR
jgi:hypothetical protein